MAASGRRSALVALVLGGGLALAAQLAAPVAVPLYDGVVVQEPYRFLSPVNGQAGSPTAYSAEKGFQGGSSPAFVAATTENPPQAQLIALDAAFVVPAGATTMKISIEAVAPASAPTSGNIVGNVYRFRVTDGAGATLAAASDARETLTLRAPPGVTEATIARLTSAGWELLPTEHGGAAALFATNPTGLGDFALIVGGAGSGGVPTIALVLGGAAIAIVAITVVWFRRGAYRARAEAAATRARIPSTRKGPRQRSGSKRRRP